MLKKSTIIILTLSTTLPILMSNAVFAAIGDRFPSERKVITDPITGVKLAFLTSKPIGDSNLLTRSPTFMFNVTHVIIFLLPHA